MTVPGYVPAIGERDLDKIIRAVRNLYENGAATNDLVGGINAHYANGAGRLSYVGTTSIKFSPFNGDLYKANGTLCAIPSSGISIASTSVRVNGTANQNLGASTEYYVSVNSAGVGGFWAKASYSHAPDTTSGNIGVEVITSSGTPQSDETLIGYIKTDGSNHFQWSATARLVASWFNRQPVNITNNTGGTVTTASTSDTELTTAARSSFWSWGDGIFIGLSGLAFNNTASSACVASVGIDAASVGQSGQILLTNANDRATPAANYSAILSEGAHTASIFGRVSAGTGSFNLGYNGIVWI